MAMKDHQRHEEEMLVWWQSQVVGAGVGSVMMACTSPAEAEGGNVELRLGAPVVVGVKAQPGACEDRNG